MVILYRQPEDPPFLTVGTEVSAKYKGAFCEAKVHKVVKSVKVKVSGILIFFSIFHFCLCQYFNFFLFCCFLLDLYFGVFKVVKFPSIEITF